MHRTPIIPAKAGIQIKASWIPAFAGMVGLLGLDSNRKSNMIPNRRWITGINPVITQGFG